MRYRIYFEALQPVEVECFDIRVTGARRLSCIAFENCGDAVDLSFPCEIMRIADNHGRDIYLR
jgi:hypothetical protein